MVKTPYIPHKVLRQFTFMGQTFHRNDMFDPRKVGCDPHKLDRLVNRRFVFLDDDGNATMTVKQEKFSPLIDLPDQKEEKVIDQAPATEKRTVKTIRRVQRV